MKSKTFELWARIGNNLAKKIASSRFEFIIDAAERATRSAHDNWKLYRSNPNNGAEISEASEMEKAIAAMSPEDMAIVLSSFGYGEGEGVAKFSEHFRSFTFEEKYEFIQKLFLQLPKPSGSWILTTLIHASV